VEQRFYASTYGRFNTPDPAGRKAAKLNDPASWNRYAYTRGDPVNRRDRTGLDDDGDCPVGPDGVPDCGLIATVTGTDGCDPLDGLFDNPAYAEDCFAELQECEGMLYAQKPFVPPPPQPYVLASSQQEANSLGQAFVIAETLLNNPNGNCASLFNIGGVGPSPQGLLLALYNGSTTLGSIAWAQLPSTIEAVASPAPGGGGPATAALNNNLNGLWFTDSPLMQAQTLLHELGHIYQFLYGAGSTAIVGPDANPYDPAQVAAQNANQLAVSKNCTN